MPNIPNVTTVRVTELYRDGSGQLLWGTVTFTPVADRIASPGNTMLVPSPIVVRVQNGLLNVDLAASDDSQLQPSGWAYQVTEEFIGKAKSTYQIVLTESMAPTVRLSSIAPLGTAIGPVPAAYVKTLNGQTGDLTVSKATLDMGNVDNTSDAAKPLSVAATTALAERAQPGFNIQNTVRKLADTRSPDDVKVLILGDSTAADGQWPNYLMDAVQAMYPHRGLKRYNWNTISNNYDAPSTIATGTNTTNPTWIHHYNGGQGGTVPESIYPTFDVRLAAIQPDLVLINFGHNYGYSFTQAGFASDTIQRQVTRERFVRLVAEVKRAVPTADIVLVSQNPWLDTSLTMQYGINELRAQMWRDIAADMGCAYAPLLETYMEQPDPLVYLNADKLHPNTAGSQLGATAVLPLFKYQRNLPASARVPSPLLVPGINLLGTNGLFGTFTPPTAPAGWTALNSTVSKNTTQFESPSGYSVRVQAAAGAGVASIFTSAPISRAKGQVVTAAARVYLPSAGATSSSGRMQVSGSNFTTLSSGTLSLARDQWIWVFVTFRVPANATFVTLSLLAGSAGTTDEFSVDRVGLFLGHLPHDVI